MFPATPVPGVHGGFAAMLLVIAAAIAACGGGEGASRIACPTLGAGYPSLVHPIAALGFEETANGAFPAGWFTGFAFVPPADVTVVATLSGSRRDARALLMLYGPRQETGAFGSCRLVSAAAADGSASLEASIPAGGSGEYLLVAANQNPLAAAGSSFQLTLTCDGSCAVTPACPEPLAPDCEISFCSEGFEVDDDGCRLCACAGAATCGPGRIVLAGQCVDPCAVNAPPDPVCGSDGVTYESEPVARCAGVAEVEPGACEDSCEAEPCELSCAGFATDPETFCRQCACTDPTDCTACPATWRPVCGSDGVTWPNACLARCGGVARVTAGPCLLGCDVPAAACADVAEYGYDGEGLCPTCALDPAAIPATAGGDHEEGCAALCSDQDDEGCAKLVARTFPTLKLAQKAGPAVAGACVGLTCATASDCEPAKPAAGSFYECKAAGPLGVGLCVHRQLCSEDDACGPSRTCTEVGASSLCLSSCQCPVVHDPVCALRDGALGTYDNACEAACAGARVVGAGACCAPRPVECEDGDVPAVDRAGCRTGQCIPATDCAATCTVGACVHVLEQEAPVESACHAHCQGLVTDGAKECNSP